MTSAARFTLLIFCVLACAQAKSAQPTERTTELDPESWQLDLKLKSVREMVKKPANALAEPAFNFAKPDAIEKIAPRKRSPFQALEAGMKFDAIELRSRIESRLGDSDFDWRHDYRKNRPSTTLP